MTTTENIPRKSDMECMSEAIALAKEKMLAGEGGPFGAVIARDGVVIARGWNRVTSSNDPTAHAEIDCIRNACSTLQTFTLNGYDLFVNCEPYPMCLAAAYWAQVSRIIYGADRHDAAAIGFADAHIYAELQVDKELRKLPMQQLMADKARATLSLWLNMEGKIPY